VDSKCEKCNTGFSLKKGGEADVCEGMGRKERGRRGRRKERKEREERGRERKERKERKERGGRDGGREGKGKRKEEGGERVAQRPKIFSLPVCFW
jgi:hypothetical protein